MKSTLAGQQPEATPSSTAFYSSSVVPTRARVAESLATVARPIVSFLRTTWSLLTWPIDWLRDFFGVESMDGRAIEGEIVIPCDFCSDYFTGYKEGHPVGQSCPRRLIGDCDVCMCVVRLDRFGNCPGGKYHGVMNRRGVRRRS